MQYRFLVFFLATVATASEHHHHHRHHHHRHHRHHADAEGCTNVSVQGDATYCVSGNICGGNGDQCPKKGDVASQDCHASLKSYTNGGKCVAPADATCQVIATGAKGCVFGAAPAATPAPTTPAGCTNVSVEGDGTYCITGPICVGTSGGGACPKKGDPVVANCVSNIPSYVSNGVCSAPKDAQCKKLHTGAYGCTFKDQVEVEQEMAAQEMQGCTNVSVQGDATYCIDGPICGGNGDQCPKKGAVAAANCVPGISSYSNGKCTLTADAVCGTVASGAKGCLLGSGGATPTVAPTTTAPTSSGGAKQCAENWSQCNGQNWPFGVCCKDANFVCNKKNEYLSLCEPKSQEQMAATVAEVDVWKQCGGNNYNGDKTCTTGNACVKLNDWYHQCQPTAATTNELPTWAQCGGKNNNFNANGKTCRSADKCQAYSEWYHQCIPK